MKKDDQFITRVELAARLGVSPSTIYNWTRWKWIRSYKLGARVVRYKLDDVKEDLKLQNLACYEA